MLIDRLASSQYLNAAWQAILTGISADEVPSQAVQRFAREATQQIESLLEALTNRTYQPRTLHHTEIPKPDGGTRALDIPPVIDRIIEKALVEVMEPHVDPHISCAAFGFRPGLGVVDAVQRIVQERDNGLCWVLRTDLNDCFPTIPRDVARQALLALLPDHSLDDLIDRLLARKTLDNGRTREVDGLPQGSALSPMLANLVLARVDDALMDSGFPVVRYADDMTVPCSSPNEAAEALKVTTRAVEELGMSIQNAKTEIMDFSTGFCFLGEDFGPFYPPVQAEHRIRDPLKRILYVGRQGSRVWIRYGRIIVTSKDDAELLSVPASHVAGIVLFGAVGLSAGVRSWLLQQGISTVFASRTGSYLGSEIPASSKLKLSRVRAQVGLVNKPQRCLDFGRAVVSAKIRHQITLVQRFNTRPVAVAVRRDIELMRQMAQTVPAASDRAELMGFEGAAAKAYFSAVSQLLPEPLRFQGRSRRPPMDVFNAAIGYGYAILLGECVTALVSCGLEPGIGMLHADDDTQPCFGPDGGVPPLCRRPGSHPPVPSWRPASRGRRTLHPCVWDLPHQAW